MKEAPIVALAKAPVARRTVLGAIIATALTKCTSTQAASNFVAAIDAFGQTVVASLPQLVAAGLVPTTPITINGQQFSIQTLFSDIESAAAGLPSTASLAQGQTTFQQIMTWVNAAASAVLPFAALIPGGSEIGLAMAALPAIEALLGIVQSYIAAPTAQVAATAPPPAASAVFGIGAPALTPSQQQLNVILQKHGYPPIG